MNPRRRNFAVALVLFFAWVGGLAFMAGFSGERPRSQGVVKAPR